MPRDIRSYFTSLSSKNAPPKNEQTIKKRSLDSSSEDVIPDTPNETKRKNKTSRTKKRRIIEISSDSGSENNTTTNTKKELKNIEEKPKDNNKKLTKPIEAKPIKKKVNPFDAFGNEPVQQNKVQKQTELDIHDDDDFEKTLLELDEEELIKNSDSSKTVLQNNKITPSKTTIENVHHRSTSPKNQVDNNCKTNLLAKDASAKKKTPAKTPSRKRKTSENTDESMMETDEDRYERKRHSAMLYQQYLQRDGPPNPGSKWIPKGKPDCLKGLSFVITGVLDSLQRDEAEILIKEHGGRCTQSVSGKVNYMVLGTDAGPSKLEKARKFGTKIISEDDLIDMICVRSSINNENKKVDDKKLERDNTATPSEKQKLSTVNTDNDIPETTIKQNKKTEENTKKHNDDDIPATTTKLKPKINDEKQCKSHNKPIDNTNKISERKETITSHVGVAWVDKYKPTSLEQIIGQQGERSNVNKLVKWLKNWNLNRTRNVSRPSPWAKDDDGSYFRAALLSGPPGVGKTTSAALVCKHLGYDTVEFNASNTRNKRMVHEEVAHILNTTSLANYGHDGQAVTKHHVLLMDEVDGMSGNEDRGGIQELIALIKRSQIPIICMCNDRQHPKIRTLANYCYDLRFAKPRVEQIRGAIMSICFKEKLKIDVNAVTELIKITGQDVRQTINQLALYATDTTSNAKAIMPKDVRLGPWEVVRKVFSAEEHKTMSLADKSKLFFYDYSIGPLFVQENYLKVIPRKGDRLECVAAAADAISLADVIDAKIRSTQNWSLLEMQGMYSSVLPGHYLSGHIGGQIDFPGWLGKNSKANKFNRMLNEIYAHSRTSMSGDRTAICLDYAPHLRDAIAEPLARNGADGIAKAVDVMCSYRLLRDDLTNLVELTQWPRVTDPFSRIDPKVKAAFTRVYNKECPALPYAPPTAASKRTTTVNDDNNGLADYDNDADDLQNEDDDDIKNDVMIKAKKATASTSKKQSSSNTKPASQKTKTTKRGKK